MKLKELSVNGFKGFDNFHTSFNSESPITAIIGQNGVGKSNLIEIIISIFRNLDLNDVKNTGFSYTLIYECRGHEVQIKFDCNNSENNIVNVDGTKKSFSFLSNNSREYLPSNVFTYYSGTNWRVEELFLKHQTKFYKSLTNGDDLLLRRFFYCRDVHSFFVLLAFLVDDDPVCKLILKKLKVKELSSVLFCLKKPYWYKNKPSEVMQQEGDPRFWYSRGVVSDFLSDLWKEAIAPIGNEETIITDFRGRREKQERLYLFLSDEQALQSLANNYPDTSSLFKNFESTYIADLLEKVDVTVTLESGEELTFSELSEGERQLITVLGLLKFTRDDESLFLLDEPDTHLNPRWKLDYFSQVEGILDHDISGTDKKAWHTSQVILTTHDPLMLTSLNAEEVRVLMQEDYQKISVIPDVDPNTLGVEAILQSDLYGIRTSLDKDLQDKIDLRNRLLTMFKSDSENDALRKRLQEINEELEQIGFSQAHPNPYFSNFAKAISRNPRFRKQSLTKNEYNQIQDFTDKLLNQILEESKIQND